MSTQGLIGFRYREKDKLTYNCSDSEPDQLGLKLLHELRNVDSWDQIRNRARDLVAIPESRPLDESSSLAEIELRRHYSGLEHKTVPKNVHELYQPLQGSLQPYLDGKLTFMPNASDFIHDSLHCKWAYIANLDTEQFEVWKGNQLEPDSEDNRLVTEENRYGQEVNGMGYLPDPMPTLRKILRRGWWRMENGQRDFSFSGYDSPKFSGSRRSHPAYKSHRTRNTFANNLDNN
jgi:hypothetical protein